MTRRRSSTASRDESLAIKRLDALHAATVLKARARSTARRLQALTRRQGDEAEDHIFGTEEDKYGQEVGDEHDWSRSRTR